MKQSKDSYRYPGVRPFGANDSDIFFGRGDDTNRLFKLIMLEKMVVLFGKSGHGKSSLISAGIIPLLNKETAGSRSAYLPIEVRLGKIAGQTETPVEKVALKLKEHVPVAPGWEFLDKYDDLPGLWKEFKNKQADGPARYLLIFDQFEEFFNYPKEVQEAFRWELAELLYTDIPQSIRENPAELSNEKFDRIAARMDIKVLISIRSDRLSLLHSMKDALPRIMESRFEIKGLSQAQAEEAIRQPALLEDERFVTHPFTYDQNTMNIILKELTKVQSDGTPSIEAFHLQIICQGCESRIAEKLKMNDIDTEVNEEDLPIFQNLYDAYYKRQLDRLPGNALTREKIQQLLETELIYQDELTGEYRRLSVDGNILRKRVAALGLSADVLQLLEDAFLIRREVNNVGGFSYEISHDTIVSPIMKIRAQRDMQQVKTAQKNWFVRKMYKQLARLTLFFVLAVIAAISVWKWETIYFGYRIISGRQEKPIIRLHTKLDMVLSDMQDSTLAEVKKFGPDYDMGTWTASQAVTGLYPGLPDSAIRKYLLVAGSSLKDTSCCCWREFVSFDDIRATSWVVSTLSTLRQFPRVPEVLPQQCQPVDFILNSQFQNGSWPMLPLPDSLPEYSSTYATCHALRALFNTLLITYDKTMRGTISRAIDRGADWLLNNMADTGKVLWKDYPLNRKKEGFISNSISGLAIHTLNLVQRASPELNKRWLENLRSTESWLPINYREQSDVFIMDEKKKGEAKVKDMTRHLVTPWQIIALVDAYPYGDFMDKVNANIWLDRVVRDMTLKDIHDTQSFIRAEIFIALKYLRNKEYIFK